MADNKIELEQQYRDAVEKSHISQHVCPNCGYCPFCGRGERYARPLYDWPYQPYYPYPVWGPTWGYPIL